MQAYEYKVVPAPTRGEKGRGLKTGADRFANALSRVMNEMAAEGWDYCRAETLPAEERSGLTSKTTVYHNMLVFRRVVENAPPRRARAEIVDEAPEGMEAVEDEMPARRGGLLSTKVPEGRAPRLGPAEEAEE
ncbi:uncharacterized protein DUF4177 [Rhodobacter sp. JA431]|uniref:DUF4177 domain-containing protein n=1 Tax=Rhodobacter sp. JA431 TaxID=570013 RepID=UPI000BD976F1|nr:DUF4177 domain-containing protein [Rhodobacter sp. JA431]SOC12257.1 uncharacterized protein DUF4177 [Rhodobacter sp. JA431]